MQTVDQFRWHNNDEYLHAIRWRDRLDDNGRIRLVDAARFTFTGSFNLGGDLNTIRHSTLSRDKISVEDVGTFPGGIISFSLTKF